ncbi:MAG: DUF1640 domain-containing protein [Deltaproteobacteria bacterium]|nr:DUF1640 domain-containing protein [Deltaproteobacteria bacterium]
MESAILFDTLAYAKKMKEAGFTDKQAETQAEALAEIIGTNLATKQDLKELEARLTASIIKWVAGMLVAQAAVIAALVKLL